MSDTATSCPDLERLEQFVESALDSTALGAIQAHLADCDACARRVAEIRDNLRLAPKLASRGEEHTVPTPAADDASTIATPGPGPRAAPPSARDERPGADVFPGYSDVSPLSRGGQGMVYRATQDGTHRPVAIKVLLDGSGASEATMRRFEREIELAGQLTHPNIVPVFHTGRTVDGRLFFVMDYVDGVPLRQYVRDQDLPLESALGLFTAVCGAVQYAHQRGIIHRDLKPSNILVDADGVPHILDFGLARQVNGAEQDLTLTQQIMGTLPYMSPEQARGERHGVDTRTDVYALGVILYELLTGFYPYPVTGNLLDVIRHIVETQPTPPSQQWHCSQSGVRRRASRRFRAGGCPIDHDVQTIVLRALTKEPERRYQSAGEFAKDIEHFLNGRPIEAKRDSFWYVLAMLARRNIPMTVVVVSVLVIIGSAATIVWQTLDVAARERTQRKASDARLEFETADIPRHLRSLPLPLFTTCVAEWRADRVDAARYVFEKLPHGSAEQIAARFVLDDQISEAVLLERLPTDRADLAWFAIGEKRLKSGDRDGARKAFQTAIAAASADADGVWLIGQFAESRLKQIGNNSPSE